MIKNRWIICVIFVFFICSQAAFAQTNEISINESTVRFSTNLILEGNLTRIYAKVQNSSQTDLKGTVQFYNQSAGAQIGSDQTISVLAGSSDDIFVDWYPPFEGTHHISITIDPWITKGDNPDNNSVTLTTKVLKDSDADGITDEEDDDDDNDGVIDDEDHFPTDASETLDSDGDRIGNNADEDDDNDSHLDEVDAFPTDAMEWDDTDKDGIGDNSDEDDDNDGLTDKEEKKAGTDPINPDTDGDGVIDGVDAFPINSTEQYDYDKDGLGDNTDDDDDDDGILDKDDSDDHNKGPIIVITGNTLFAYLNREANFSAAESYDEDGSLSYITWKVNGEQIKTGKEFSYTFTSKGKKQIKITILDDKKESREMEFEISVINLDFYLIVMLTIIIILLAILINLKYSSWAKKLLTKLKK